MRAAFVLGLAGVCLDAAAFTAVAPAAARMSDSWVCPDEKLSVVAASEAAAQVICAQGVRAREFLARCGITGRHKLSVNVTREIGSTGPGNKKAGDFDPTLGRIRLLPFMSYLRVAKLDGGKGMPVARALHASVAAHEIAHGIFHEHTAHLDLPVTVHEYVAYVVQFATLPDEVRRSQLQRYEIVPATSLFVFSFFLLNADPERFALNAWAHFDQPGNGCAFLHRVMEGKVHFPPGDE